MLLVAKGPTATDSWQKAIPPTGTIVLGRNEEEWNAPWEQFLGRQHVEMTLKIDRIKVRRLSASANPIFHSGKQSDSFELQLGESFVIGRTTFTLADRETTPTPSSKDERLLVDALTVAPGELSGVAFRDAPHRLDVLSRLPAVISSASDDPDLFSRLADMLLAGIRRAEAVALVQALPSGGDSKDQSASQPGAHEHVTVLHWDRRFTREGTFEPSRRLIVEAVEKQNQTVLHVWGSEETRSANDRFTLRGGFDWAF